VQRVGIGYDVHRLVVGRPLILGDVTIPFEKGLLGHSDADVLCHAIADALLGAASLGDIGIHFPNTDPQWLGVSSLLLLQKVKILLADAGYRIDNIDSVLIAEKPKIKPFIELMVNQIAQALAILPAVVSVKATTSEGLGFAGKGKGMAAQAIVLISKI